MKTELLLLVNKVKNIILTVESIGIRVSQTI